MRFAVYQVSRKGGRDKNEDRMGYCYTRDAGLFALADGMGGHPRGEVAAQLALQTIAAAFQRDARPRLVDPPRFLHDALIDGHQALQRYASQQAMSDTPRTTIVACVLQGDAAYWAHCGDSRLYWVRDAQVLARTRDHSYLELQATLPQVVPLGLQPGDRLLLCSDGLWGTVADAEIAAGIGRRPISDAVPDLVELALRRGGERGDNVTVLAVEWEAAEDAEAQGVQTQSLGEDLFASSIQTTGVGDAAADLDDAEIERSIQEINDAIRRSTPPRG